MSDISLNESDEVTIADSAGVNKLTVNSDGSTNAFVIIDSLLNKLYSLSLSFNLPSNGTETRVILIKNPNASGKILKLEYMLFAGSGPTIRIYADPTITTNGTAVTPVATNVGNATASVITPFTSPTISANGSQILADILSNQTASRIDMRHLITVAENNNMLITGQPTSNNTLIQITLVWAEI